MISFSSIHESASAKKGLIDPLSTNQSSRRASLLIDY
jgi:hypothetical protein